MDGEPSVPSLTRQLVEVLLAEGFVVTHALGVKGYPHPPYFPNESFGKMEPRRPAVVAFDPAGHREVFGLVRPTREDLASEDSLEEYHLFLDRNAEIAGEPAEQPEVTEVAGDSGGSRGSGGPGSGPALTGPSAVYVIFPEPLLPEFTGILTHEIHREYWHRIVPVPYRVPPLV